MNYQIIKVVFDGSASKKSWIDRTTIDQFCTKISHLRKLTFNEL